MGNLNISDLSREDIAFLLIMDSIATQAAAAKFAFSNERQVAFQVIEDSAAKMCAAVLSRKNAG